MADALKRLGEAVSSIEKQSQEIEQYKGVLKKVSDIGNEAQKTNERASQLINNQDDLIAKNMKFMEEFQQAVEQQNKNFEDFDKNTNKQISDFSHEFIEKSSQLRDESLNAHIDLRQDMDRLNKGQKQLEELIQNTNKSLNDNLKVNIETIVSHHDSLNATLLKQEKKIKGNNYLNIFTLFLLVFLLTLEFIPNL